MDETDPDNTDAFKRREHEYADYSNELAGRSTKIARFFNGQSRDDQTAQSRKRDDETIEFLTSLQQLLKDPEYEALYNGVSNSLREAEIEIENALTEARQQFDHHTEALDETLKGASRLPDGTAVFRDEQGRIFSADGREVGDEEAQSIVWREGAVTYEEYLARRKAVEDAQRRLDELHGVQIDLGGIHDRLDDEDNPMSMEELEEAEQKIDEVLGTISQKDDEVTPLQESTIEPTSDIKLIPIK